LKRLSANFVPHARPACRTWCGMHSP
jgi:hypothetical protein